MKVGVLVLPDSTCHKDMIRILESIFELQTIPIKFIPNHLPDVSVIVVADGAKDLNVYPQSAQNALLGKLTEYAQSGGYVLGISEGFELLCNLGLLPGTVVENSSKRFVCRNAHILPDSKLAAPTAYLQRNRALRLPVSHARGNYQADTRTLANMRVNGQILFRYCDDQGVITEAANPNGSVENIAGVCNGGMNVFGIMPRPERAADAELGNTDGYILLDSLFRFVKSST